MLINTETRSEIIRLRVTPTEKKQFASFSSSQGKQSATMAYLLAINAMSAHVKPRHRDHEGAIHRPLKPSRQHKCPATRGYGGATINRLRV